MSEPTLEERVEAIRDQLRERDITISDRTMNAVYADIAEVRSRRTELYDDLCESQLLDQYMNNITWNLPGGERRTRIEEGETSDITPRQRLQEDFREPAQRAIREVYHTAQYLDRKPTEFFGDIDAALAEAGLDPQRIAELNQCRIEHSLRGLSTSNLSMRELNALILPAYLLLREQGYNHYELIK